MAYHAVQNGILVLFQKKRNIVSHSIAPLLLTLLNQPTPKMNTATRPLISWTHYFKLRKSRQITERLTSLLSGSIGGISSTYYFGAVADFDPVTLVFGFIEPQMAAISASMLIGGVAWGIGNQVGAGVWRLTQTLEIKNGIDAV
jgi:hypothetical protein